MDGQLQSENPQAATEVWGMHHSHEETMAKTDQIVLVAGATGRQGGAVIRHLLPKGWKVRALTRSPKSAAAQKLQRQGIEVVHGDLEDAASLEAVVRGVHGVYSVQDFWSVGARGEV